MISLKDFMKKIMRNIIKKHNLEYTITRLDKSIYCDRIHEETTIEKIEKEINANRIH